MPHYTIDNKLVVTYQELVVAGFYKSVKSVEVVVHRHEKRGWGMRKASRGHNSGEATIYYDSLPSSYKEAIIDPRASRPVLEAYYEVDGNAVDFYNGYRFADGSSISDGRDGGRDLLGIYVANASILQAAIRLKEDRITTITRMGHTPKKIYETILGDVINFRKVYAKEFCLESDLPEHPKRFKECFLNFGGNNYEYLISGKHKNSNSLKNNTQTKAILESLFATQKHKPTYTEVASTYDGFLAGYVDVINNETGELYNPKDFKPLSKETINGYLRTWSSKIATFTIRGGDRQKLINQFVPSHKMIRSQYACSLVSVDDRQPPFEYIKGERPWLYMGIDDGSQCYIAWVYGKSKEGILLDFYRQMVRNCYEWGISIPLELEAESSLNSSYQDTLLKPGNMFKYVRIEANNARAKTIERYHKYARYENEKKQEGWIARPFARSEANQAGSGKVPCVPYEVIYEKTLHNIQEWNNSEHSGYKGKTRWEVLLEKQNPKAKPINWRGIVPYIGYKTATSCNVGEVCLQSGQYLLGDEGEIYLGERLINLMSMIEGEQIEAYWIDDNDGNMIKAYAYIGGQYICELLTKPEYKRARAEQAEDDFHAREIMSSYVATIEAYRKHRMKAIEKVTVIDYRKKTLNDKFQIRGINALGVPITPSPSFEPVEVLGEVENSFKEELNAFENMNTLSSYSERF